MGLTSLLDHRSKMIYLRSSVYAFWVFIAFLFASENTEAQALNATFAPWTVMGPVSTNGSGSVAINFTGDNLSYTVSLFNVIGLHSVEIHVGDANTHGVACAGILEPTGLLGPLLLPLGNHLEVSDLYDR